jgi:hypothetical protein
MSYLNHGADSVYPTPNASGKFASDTSMPATEPENSWANWWDTDDLHGQHSHWLENQSGPAGLANWDNSLNATTVLKAHTLSPDPISGNSVSTRHPEEIKYSPMMNSFTRLLGM